ncbi:uncharacterized protein LOC126282257 [Schistocerca gregaria]|uniref:uncharacterized protein LOC126282257 n=1 Tax=Schistocerca gregaria TaxID=7010 RepID=UPI00211EDD94|nr:uncharacterized protein LOC126282257 [Schistocerca gregaria]
MRPRALASLIAVVSLAACLTAPSQTSAMHSSRPGGGGGGRRSQRSRDHHALSGSGSGGGGGPEADVGAGWRSGGRLTTRQLQTLVSEASANGAGAVECCPSRVDMVAPVGGTNKDGDYVELFNSDEHQQSFFEVSCDDSVVDRPCMFVDHRLQNQSKCVQKYSYSYALVREPQQSGWRLDYVRVRSGCSCEITPRAPPHAGPHPHPRGKARRRDKSKRRQRTPD